MQKDSGEKTPAYPIYKDDLALDIERETNQQFYRRKLSGKLIFIGPEYDKIVNAAFETEFNVYLEISWDFGKTFSPYYHGKFMMTDCTVNKDNKTVSVQPEVVDEYGDILAGMDKEFNLIELKPAIDRIKITKRPLIQMYVPGDSIISCFLSGMYWEQDVVTPITDKNQLVNKYFFSLNSICKEITITPNGTPSDCGGVYSGRMTKVQRYYYKGRMTKKGDSRYYIDVRQIVDDSGIPAGAATYTLYRKSDGVKLFYDENVGESDFTMDGLPPNSSGDVRASVATYNVFARYLLDVQILDGKVTKALPADDIVDDNRNYKRAIGYGINVVYLSQDFSDEPTEWGRADNGKYFRPPIDITGTVYFPLAQSTWRTTSLWFAFSYIDEALEQKGRAIYTLKDAFPLSSVISVLLGKVAPGITHDGTEEYSQFLYGTNPLTQTNTRLYITQKTNIINGEYKEPAQNAPITLSDVLNMLKNVYKCYWFIEDGKLKVEHINYFRNGGSYATSPKIGYDLTQLVNIRNGKPMSFATSEYSYDKSDMPERYEVSWMDEVTLPFRGMPIEVVSKYVQAGKIEDVTISNFTSDIDYMLLNPSEISNDGFAILSTVRSGADIVVPFIKINIGGTIYTLQNGYLSMGYVQPEFWRYDAPARRMGINGRPDYAQSIARNKKQTVSFPAGDDEPDPNKLIKTELGSGQVEKISLNLSSRYIKANLKYDTE